MVLGCGMQLMQNLFWRIFFLEGGVDISLHLVHIEIPRWCDFFHFRSFCIIFIRLLVYIFMHELKKKNTSRYLKLCRGSGVATRQGSCY